MLILDQQNLDLKRLMNIQKCHSTTKVDHCAIGGGKNQRIYFEVYLTMSFRRFCRCTSHDRLDIPILVNLV